MKRKPSQSKFPLALLIALGCSFSCFSLIGCDDSDPSLGQLSGTVKYQQNVLTGGMLEFVGAREDESEFNRMANVNEDGSYQVIDLPTGSYLIAVSTATLEGLPNYIALPQKLESSKTSGLKYDVKPGKQNHLILID